jgi:hypothetical protein
LPRMRGILCKKICHRYGHGLGKSRLANIGANELASSRLKREPQLRKPLD